jgi:hypothetical protein
LPPAEVGVEAAAAAGVAVVRESQAPAEVGVEEAAAAAAEICLPVAGVGVVAAAVAGAAVVGVDPEMRAEGAGAAMPVAMMSRMERV